MVFRIVSILWLPKFLQTALHRPPIGNRLLSVHFLFAFSKNFSASVPSSLKIIKYPVVSTSRYNQGRETANKGAVSMRLQNFYPRWMDKTCTLMNYALRCQS